MIIGDVMTKNVDTVHVSCSVQQAAVMMRDGGYGSLPVEENNRLRGMVTDRDLALRVVAEGRNPTETSVSECMTPGISYCFQDESIEDVCFSMVQSHHQRLPVLNSEKRLVGIVSITDIANFEAPLTVTHEVLRHLRN